MLPFMAETIKTIVRRLVQKFIIEEVFEEGNTASKLCKLNVSNKAILLPAELVDIGTARKHAIRSVCLQTEAFVQEVMS